MNTEFKKKLASPDAMAIFKMGDSFIGSEISKFTAIKVNERIALELRKGSKSVVLKNEDGTVKKGEDGKPLTRIVPPEFIEITFSRAELDGLFIGVKETIKLAGVSSNDVVTIGYLCGVLGMSSRFKNYADSVLKSIEVDPTQLDEEIVVDPLD